MSQEIRRVTKDWKHPVDVNNHYIPLLHCYDKVSLECQKVLKFIEDNNVKECYYEFQLVDDGNVYYYEPSLTKNDINYLTSYKANKEVLISEINEDRELFKERDYMFLTLNETHDHYQLYENTTDGTPISPVFPTIADLNYFRYLNNIPQHSTTDYTYKLSRLFSSRRPVKSIFIYVYHWSSTENFSLESLHDKNGLYVSLHPDEWNSYNKGSRLYKIKLLVERPLFLTNQWTALHSLLEDVTLLFALKNEKADVLFYTPHDQICGNVKGQVLIFKPTYSVKDITEITSIIYLQSTK